MALSKFGLRRILAEMKRLAKIMEKPKEKEEVIVVEALKQSPRKTRGVAMEMPAEYEEGEAPLRGASKQTAETNAADVDALRKKVQDLEKILVESRPSETTKTGTTQMRGMQDTIEDLHRRISVLSTAATAGKTEEIGDIGKRIATMEQAMVMMQSKQTGGNVTFIAGGEPITTPVIFEFPRVAEEVKSYGFTGTAQKAMGDVRGVPSMLALPKAEKTRKISSEWEPTVASTINIRYALIEPYAYVNIRWNERTQEVVYTVIEPPLTKKEDEVLKKLMGMIVDLLDINLMTVTEMGAVKKYLREKIDQLIEDYGFDLSKPEYDKLSYYMERNFMGLGTVEPMMQDSQIEDISCDGVGIPIFVFHRKYGSMKANVQFDDEDELNKFITKLSQRAGKHISVADPLVDGALPDGSRLQATYSTGGDIATKGSTFTIRKFTKDPLTIIDLMNFGTIPSTIAAYLWLAIEFRNSVLIAGGTATGKTSTLNTLCLFLHPEAKIVSIEDTPELALPHEHWVAKISRSGYGPEVSEGRRRGEVSMYDLLRAALRERPDEMIVGEVRGKEAYVLFQAMATGHAGMATIHAESTDAVINRLVTAPIDLSPGLLQHLNLILVMTNARIKGVDVRRIKEVVEILGVDMKTEKPITNQLFKWVVSGDYYEFASDKSFILNKIIGEKGISEGSVWEELQRRTAVLEWMKKEGIRYYKDVGRIIALYYKSPEEILKRVFGDKV